jgi:hypothetical protein
MQTEFIDGLSSSLQQIGYFTVFNPNMPDAQGLLYAHSIKAFRLGFAKAEDHFLFLDWDNAIFGRLDLLIATYKNFSKFVNLKFPVSHSLRIRIPNLAVVAISQIEFPEETIKLASTTYFNPWYGGETGQILLVDLGNKKIHYHKPPFQRQSGSLPLFHTIDILLELCQKYL